MTIQLTVVQLLYAQGMILGPTIFFSKEAIFLLYLEIFQVKQIMRRAIYIGMISTGLIYWPSIILESILCAPHVGESWDILAGASWAKRCPRNSYWGVVQGAGAVWIDLYIFVLPIPIILGLQLSRRSKLQVLAVFMTAFMYVCPEQWLVVMKAHASRGIMASVFAEVYRVRLLTSGGDILWAQSQQLICV